MIDASKHTDDTPYITNDHLVFLKHDHESLYIDGYLNCYHFSRDNGPFELCCMGKIHPLNMAFINIDRYLSNNEIVINSRISFKLHDNTWVYECEL